MFPTEKQEKKVLSDNSSKMLKIVHASMVFKFVACFVEEKNAFNIYPCFLENTYLF